MFRCTILISAIVAALAFGVDVSVSPEDVQNVRNHLAFVAEILEHHMENLGGRRQLQLTGVTAVKKGVDTATTAVGTAQNAANTTLDTAKTAVGTAQNAANTALATAKTALSAGGEAAQNAVNTTLDTAKTALSAGEETVKGAAKVVVSDLKQVLKVDQLKCVKSLVDGVRALDGDSNALKRVAGSCVLAFGGSKRFESKCVNTLASVLEAPENCAQTMFNVLQCALSKCAKECSPLLTAVVQNKSIKNKDDIKVAAVCGVCAIPCFTKEF